MATKYKKPIKKTDGPKIICQNKDCIYMGKHLPLNNFYKSRSKVMPHHPFCKDCVDKMVDAGNLQTVYDILRVLDTPFIMDVWNEALLKNKVKYFGDYLNMINRRKTYDSMTFEDSIFELSDVEEIHEEVQEIIDDIPQWNDEWQGEYSRADLTYLQNYYEGLNNDFKIITTNHKDYAKKIAQASLSQTKAYQKLLRGEDGADVAYEKATKMFDMLSKSAQFAESQRGANDVALGCFGRVFDAVEKNNWVPTYIPTDEDMYDKLLKEFSNINRSL